MSFSHKMKEELIKHISSQRHCQIAELAALYYYSAQKDRKSDSSNVLIFRYENEAVIRKCFTLLKKTFNMYKDFSWDDVVHQSGQIYELVADNGENVATITDEISMPGVITKSCCKRAFLRGAFLAAGSISDPEKSYHLEYVCQDMESAGLLQEILQSFDIEAKIFERKNSCVVYIKDGTQIAEALNVCGAHVTLMDFENMRILKEMRNSVNRQVNCETANINKTVSAAQKMIDEITFLMGTNEYDGLAENLKEIAALRIEYPEASLTELGELCNPKVGKSGVNHRLRKLSEIALRTKGGEL